MDLYTGIADIDESAYSLHSFEELLQWLSERKEGQSVSIQNVALENCSPWYYDEHQGVIRNPKGTFFQIGGIRGEYDDGMIVEQPIIIQKEIGFLGVICKKINGVWHFLMQAKIEPGNLNYVQISPTLQATKSNFTRQHGGKKPEYLDYFMYMKKEDVLVDQIQSEQSSRFIGKRNRNVIVKTDSEIEESDTHKWITLVQLKRFMSMDNLINMDTRTVFSCLPYIFIASTGLKGYSEECIRSIKTIDHSTVTDIFLRLNNVKMFHSPVVSYPPLFQLGGWEFQENVFKKAEGYPFDIIFCRIGIEGREVSDWNQPLIRALGKATFGLICCKEKDTIEILVHVKSEIGCFDTVELGPTVQEEYGAGHERDEVTAFFFEHLMDPERVRVDVVLSEEGGRFYHEQNRNVIMYVDKKELPRLPERYIWATLGTLNSLTQVNNFLNIQLRNLLALFMINN